MKFRSFLLGTAAALAVTGGAQAADLAIAVEPIDYVKVCDAFGVGYYYIPGTDTCLRFNGRARLDFDYIDGSVGDSELDFGNVYALGIPADADPDEPYDNFIVRGVRDDYSQPWKFKANLFLSATARTMTDLGPVITHVALAADNDQSNYNDRERFAVIDNVYGAIGPLLFGWTNSTFDGLGAFTYDVVAQAGADSNGGVRSDEKVNQIRFSYLMGTWGIMLGLEDPRDRYGSAKNATGDYPDIVLALTGAFGGFDFKLSGAVTDRTSGTGWGVALNGEADITPGFALRYNVAYSDNAPTYVGIPNCFDNCGDEGSAWSAFLSGLVALTGNLDLAATVSYADLPDSFVNDNFWSLAIGPHWFPTANSEIGLEGYFLFPNETDNIWGLRTRLQTTF